jgi:hypothetical protein
MNSLTKIVSNTPEELTTEFLLGNTPGLPPTQGMYPRMVQIFQGKGVLLIGNTVHMYNLSTEGQSVFYIPANTLHLFLPVTTTLVRTTQYYGSSRE